MKTDLHHLMTYLRAQEYSMNRAAVEIPPKPVITISRERGSQGSLIARKTADFLTKQSHDSQPWAVIDRNLAEHVMNDHHLSERIGHLFTEERAAFISARVEKMLGFQSPQQTEVEQMTQIIMRLAEMGRVIFVGRAANVITAHLTQACHVRIFGSFERRVQRVMKSDKLSQLDAETLVQEADYHRSHFVSDYFGEKVENPFLYDLIINTDRVSVDKAVLMISQLLPASVLHLAAGVEASDMRTHVPA